MSLPTQHKVCSWDPDYGLTYLIGTGKEGNEDGRALKCKLFQPTGLCAEFDNVLYVSDYQAATLKVFSTMSNTGVYLNAIGNLFKAFSVHGKRAKYELKTLTEQYNLQAIPMMRSVALKMRSEVMRTTYQRH